MSILIDKTHFGTRIFPKLEINPGLGVGIRGGNRTGLIGSTVGRVKIGQVFLVQNLNSLARPKNRAGWAK